MLSLLDELCGGLKKRFYDGRVLARVRIDGGEVVEAAYRSFAVLFE